VRSEYAGRREQDIGGNPDPVENPGVEVVKSINRKVCFTFAIARLKVPYPPIVSAGSRTRTRRKVDPLWGQHRRRSGRRIVCSSVRRWEL